MSVAAVQRKRTGTTKSGARGKDEQNTIASTDEILAFCPKCKTFETLCFVSDKLIRTQKFNQQDGHVYHNCGSELPCRLISSLWKRS
jgi:hypothetical protein